MPATTSTRTAIRDRRPPTRRLLLGAGTGLVGLVGLGLSSSPAAAHVSPDRTEVPAGAYTDIKLGVGHGCEASPTTRLEVQVPDALLAVTPYVVPGWTVTVTPETLDTPVEGGHGEQVTERDAVVTWTAEPGQELPDGFKLQFGLSFQAPDAAGTSLHFPTVQTCQEGSSDWIEIADEGEDEPEFPAPVVQIVAGDGDAHGAPSADGSSGDTGGTGGTATTDDRGDDDDDDDDDTSSGLAIAGLVAGLGGLGLGGAAFAKSRR